MYQGTEAKKITLKRAEQVEHSKRGLHAPGQQCVKERRKERQKK